MHLPYQFSAFALTAVLGLGCSANRTAADRHFDSLKSEITRLQADQDRLTERLEGLEARQNKKGSESAGTSERPPLKVVVLQPETEPQGDPNETDSPEVDDAPRTTVRAHGSDDDGGKGGKRAKKDTSKPEADAERDYQDLLGLVKKKQHRRAVEQITAFLVRWPANPRAESAMFWLAEAHAALGDVDKAQEQYEAVVARFPQGSKTPDALLRLVAMHKKRGADDRARELLTRLRSDFPQSDAARRAPKE